MPVRSVRRCVISEAAADEFRAVKHRAQYTLSIYAHTHSFIRYCMYNVCIKEASKVFKEYICIYLAMIFNDFYIQHVYIYIYI